MSTYQGAGLVHGATWHQSEKKAAGPRTSVTEYSDPP